MINCFNFDGDPKQNHVLPGFWDQNTRLIVVRSKGETVSVALAKIRKDEDGRPVIFLERALYSGTYDFHEEMLDHLFKKARNIPGNPRVAKQVFTKEETEKGEKLYSTGGYGKDEYAEALFGVRETDRVSHKGKIMNREFWPLHATGR